MTRVASTVGRRRFSLLDGQRGLAALIVMFRHCDTTRDFLPVSYLAVDFFFVLSGFVIAHTYEQRLLDRTTSISEFLRIRFVRLYPMVVFGTILGAIPIGAQLILGGYPIGSGALVSAFIRQMFLIPSPPLTYELNGLYSIFPFNMPEWSLFFEVFANIAFAVLVFYMTGGRLLALVIVAGMGLAAMTIAHGSMILGVDLQTLPGGLCRVAYSFAAGLLIHRFSRPRQFQYGPAVSCLLSAVLVGLLICPQPLLLPNDISYEIFVVLICFPLLVFLGAHATTGPGLSAVCDFGGRLSYPLYLTHFPVVFAFNWLIEKQHLHGMKLIGMLSLQFVIAITVAVVALVVYDEPIRRAISSKLFLRRSPA